MKTYEELLEQLGEGELANVSFTFWIDYHDRLDPSKSTTREAYEALIMFQRGWLACKEQYNISD